MTNHEISQDEDISAANFDHHYQLHLKHLKLKGLQPKTIDAYARAIRRIGATTAGIGSSSPPYDTGTADTLLISPQKSHQPGSTPKTYFVRPDNRRFDHRARPTNGSDRGSLREQDLTLFVRSPIPDT